jgi:hypothetical protein
MADWRKLAKRAILSDGHIDKREVQLIKAELFADGKLDKSELEFLFELRREATSVVRDFNAMVFQALKPVILADGEVTAKEAEWLRKFVFADGKIDEDEKKFLADLKASASKNSPEFLELCKQAGV